MAPRISVLITAYQAERDIGPCLASLSRQIVADWEAVVVDDGSTDGTRDVVRRLIRGDDRIRMLSLGANCGPGAGRNAGLRLCRGDWVALLDAHDQFLPTRLERLLAVAASSGADMVADDLRLMSYPDSRDRGQAFGPGRWPADGRLRIADYVRGNDFSPTRYTYGYLKPMVRRSLLDRHGIRFREDLMVCEDYHFHLDCLLVGADWRLLPDAQYRYALRPASLSRALSVAGLETVLAHSHAQLADRRIDERVRHLLRHRHDRIARLLAYLRFRQELRQHWTEALAQALCRPSLLAPGLEALWRRVVQPLFFVIAGLGPAIHGPPGQARG